MQLQVLNFMRTVLSAIMCTKANLDSNFDTLEQKQEHVTSLLQRGSLGLNALKLKSTGEPKLNFVKSRRALNRVLLSQLLQKQIGLENSDLVKIQDSCPYLRKLKARVLNLQTEKFSIHEKVLYKTEKVLGTVINKLAIPSNFAEQILFNNHYTMSIHMSAQSHVETFSSNFYVKGCMEIAKRVVKKCVVYQLNSNNYNQKTSGTAREEALNSSPGEIVYIDSIYLNCTHEGYKFCVVFVD